MTTLPAPHRCLIIPPYLLQALARHEDLEVAECARRTLDVLGPLQQRRQVRTARSRPGEEGRRQPGATGFIPPEVQERAEQHRREEPTGSDTSVEAQQAPQEPGPEVLGPRREIYDAQHGTDLPGLLVRREGEQSSNNPPVNQAYDGLGQTWEFYWTAYERNSVDGQGLTLVASVHYSEKFDNAFWDGEQMVFGDGDGVYFHEFTGCLDVIGHELTHGVTQYTAGLTYVGQSGALNESVSDAFGSCVKQMALGQTAEQADWLIGEGLFTKKVHGVALRSMKAPGTAYDDPHLGKDPQPATMAGYVDLPHDEQHDNGGVHTNSGIPNHAFYLAATSIGGHTWEGAGQVWYDVLTGGQIAKDVDFASFAQATVDAAGKRFGADSTQAQAVQDAWVQVEVLQG
ncbi:MAG TPA: M4 family metallopeptidase [Segeticoccus sp.]|uniref:M4 family metallopeptidase n=1 Tax=Segeticoccus sp. TaxID=2706531 RepID=UPI002D7EABE4|nr:M4 family metallopeptidase [Segeticoccus sp.]HET8599594.1 M4 family metallopeptidase [Segeticoccus sp.]